MKTYLFDTFNRYKRFSEKLDAKTILCEKSWWVFNDNGEKEVYIFQTDGTLIISIKGKVNYSNWKYIAANRSIIITSRDHSYMIVPAFVDDNILALQVDGTNEYAFLIDEQKLRKLTFRTYNDILWYFIEKEKSLGPAKTTISVNATDDKTNIITEIVMMVIFLISAISALVYIVLS